MCAQALQQAVEGSRHTSRGMRDTAAGPRVQALQQVVGGSRRVSEGVRDIAAGGAAVQGAVGGGQRAFQQGCHTLAALCVLCAGGELLRGFAPNAMRRVCQTA